jgi:hypothetical protein
VNVLYTRHTMSPGATNMRLAQQSFMADLKSGRFLKAQDIIPGKESRMLNNYIEKALLAQPDKIRPEDLDHIWHGKRWQVFLNGECAANCNLVLDGHGLHVFFAPGELNTDPTEEVDVLLDRDFLHTLTVNPLIMKAAEAGAPTAAQAKKHD